MSSFIVRTGSATTTDVCDIITISRGMSRQDSGNGNLINPVTARGRFMNSRESQIYDFCYDLGLLWAMHPDLRFGEIIKRVVDKNETVDYISDPEVMDLIREYLGG